MQIQVQSHAATSASRRDRNFEVEIHEPPTPNAATPTLLLIAGMGQQLTAWPTAFIHLLTAKGFRIIRYDHRDVGLSCGFDHLGTPSLFTQSLRYQMGLKLAAPYCLADMAQDAWGILDALEVKQVHLVGISLGGMVAQIMAAEQSERVLSVALLMTTSGARGLPGPKAIARKAMMSRPVDSSPEAFIQSTTKALKLLAGPAYPPEEKELRSRVEGFHARAHRPAGAIRHMLAGIAGPDRSPLLAKLKMPTLIVHGEDDPLVPIECGRDLAKKIPNAKKLFIPGLGHDLPAALHQRIAQAILANTQAANATH
jgi:pimeloyl-ACP methyl ester carboxylesterase